MKSLGELMAEIGFNKGAPIETQKAFIKNLIQAADAQLPRHETAPILKTKIAEPAPVSKKSQKKKMQIKEQLEFNFGEVDRVS